MTASKTFLAGLLALSLPLTAAAQAAPAAPPAEAPKPPAISWYGILHTGFFFNGGTFAAQDAAYQGMQTANTGGSTYFSARQSRAGMKLNLGDDNFLGASVTGVLEFDFMGTNTASPTVSCKDVAATATSPAASICTTAGSSTGAYNPNIRLRHAAMTAAWKTGFGDVSLLVGQEWDVLLNLNPDSVVYLANPMFGQSGNLFRRVPQVRVSWLGGFGDLGVGVQLLAMSPVDSLTTSTDNGAGNQARFPNLEGRAYVSMKGDIGGTIGVGFETEKRRFLYVAGTGDRKDVTTSLFGVDADLNLTKYAQVKGEYFQDNGMADAMAGMTSTQKITFSGATAATFASHVVKSTGYWAQAILKPIPLVFVTVGMGSSKIDKPSLDAANGAAVGNFAATDRLENSSTSVGLIVNVSKAWKLGLDYYMTTSKYQGGTGADLRPAKVDISQVALGSQLRF
jgi:hypothetical protein